MKNIISISFDDGWKNQFTKAFPVLEKHNLKGTFYVITNMTEHMLKEGEGRMDQYNWKELSKNGHEIGSHSKTHPNMQFFLNGEKEILGSKKDLENLGIKVETFAYPYGRRNPFVVSTVRKSGYTGARLYDDKINDFSNIDRFRLHCVGIYANTRIEEIEKILKENENKWIIFGFHQIEQNPPYWGVTPSFFEKFCELIASKDIPVKTIADVLKLV